MHLISSLASGVAGAENGTVSMVLRGTSTPATYYTDFEGTSSATATNVSLDQYGGKVMFVNALVTVTVRNSGGSIVRQFTDGVAAPAVEVRSASFNGAAYSGGAVAPGNPTTLQSVLDKWVLSAGAEDFKVVINSVDTNLSTAFSAVAGLRYYVVTDALYGAVGDGVVNDLSAVQAAINAANAAGGGVVFFPKGTYLLNGSLTTYSTVTLQGYAADLTILKEQSSSASMLTGSAPAAIRDLSFRFVAATYTGNLMSFSGPAPGTCVIERVLLDSVAQNTMSTGIFFNFTGAGVQALTLVVRDSTLYLGDTGRLTSGSYLHQKFSGCSIYATDTSASSNSIINSNSSVTIADSFIQVQGASGTRTVVDSPVVASSGLRLSVSHPGTTIVFYTSSGFGRIAESGTMVERGSGNTLVLYSGFPGSGYMTTEFGWVVLGSRQYNTAVVSGDTDPCIVTADQARHVTVRVTSTAGWTGNCDVTVNKAPRGDDVIVSFWNDTGGAVTFVWGTNVSVAAATTFAVAANSYRTFHLVSGSNYPTSTTLEWFIVADAAGAEVVE